MADNLLDYNATEAATILLKDYRERRQEFHVFDDYDQAMTQMREIAKAKIEKLDEPLKTVASRLFYAMDKGFFLFQVCEWKLDYLAEALIHAIEAKNPLALANNCRALVEHLAALVAIVKELDRLEKSLRGQGKEEVINDALGKTEKFIHLGYYGKSPKISSDRNKRRFMQMTASKPSSKRWLILRKFTTSSASMFTPTMGAICWFRPASSVAVA